LFFFSSRRRHTRSKRDWSSDVCSSDLEEINQQHTNKSYVSVDLPEGIIAYHDLKAAIKDTDAILFVVPSKAVREICAKIKDDLPKNVTIIHASKGIEPGTHKRIS